MNSLIDVFAAAEILLLWLGFARRRAVVRLVRGSSFRAMARHRRREIFLLYRLVAVRKFAEFLGWCFLCRVGFAAFVFLCFVLGW